MLFLTNILLLASVFNIGALSIVKRPNFVLFIATDNDVELGGMTPLQNVKQLIGNRGVTFKNAVDLNYLKRQGPTGQATSHGEQTGAAWGLKVLEWRPRTTKLSPSNCPSRASFLTGMYPHNHGTLNSSVQGGCYDKDWRDIFEKLTFATELQEEGYKTFYAGKYLDNYGKSGVGGRNVVPPGWSDWHTLTNHSGGYYNFTVSNNGVAANISSYYITDALRDFAVQFIEEQTENTPFLMVVAPNAPEMPAVPAPRHQGRYQDVKAPRTPSFNAVAGMDKHWLLRMQPTPIPAHFVPQLDLIYRHRLETLLSVDELITDVVSALGSRNFLDNTYLVYTADCGFHVGQFSQFPGSRQPYETDIKIPLVISGPGIKANSTLSTPVLNIDLAPSILSLAGLQPPPSMDGNVIDFELSAKDNPEVKSNTKAKDLRLKDNFVIKVKNKGVNNTEFYKKIGDNLGANDNLGADVRYMLIEYYGEGSKRSSEDGCASSSDDDLFGCKLNTACKCEDATNNTFGCIRSIANNVNIKYCRFRDDDNSTEVYDLSTDPYELKNIYHEMSSALSFWYELILEKMSTCSGSTECSTRLVGWDD